MSPLPFRLKRTLGRSHKVDLDDTRRTKQALQRLGYFETPRYGLTDYPDEPLFQAIEKFQSDHDLRRDGIMRPDGETARRLGEILAGTERTNRRFVRDIIYGPPINPGAMPTAFAIHGEIGEGRRNDPDDLEATRRGLAWAGYQAGDPAEPDQPVTAEEVVDTIRRFQEAEGLKADGWMRPGGETERALDEAIAPKIAAALEVGDEDTDDGATAEDIGDVRVAQAQAIPFLLGGAAVVGGAIDTMRRQGKRPWSGDSWPEGDPAAGSRRTEIADPLPPVPPSEPDDEKPESKEEFPANPPDVPTLRGQPLNEVLKSDPVVFQALSDEVRKELERPVESDRGDPPTQWGNRRAMRLGHEEFEVWKAAQTTNPSFDHIGGSYTIHGEYKKEKNVRHPDAVGTKGSSHADMTVELRKSPESEPIELHINTGKMLKDGKTLIASERRQLARLAHNAVGAAVEAMPKFRPGMDVAEWEERVRQKWREIFEEHMGSGKKPILNE